MNSIRVLVKKIENYDYINKIKVYAKQIELNIITLQLLENLQEGNEISIIFKEAEVIITKDFSCFIGVENIIPSHIVEINNGALFSEIFLNSECGYFKALITREAFIKINIARGDKVHALIKANEIGLEV